jgi:hypothetical protein
MKLSESVNTTMPSLTLIQGTNPTGLVPLKKKPVIKSLPIMQRQRISCNLFPSFFIMDMKRGQAAS